MSEKRLRELKDELSQIGHNLGPQLIDTEGELRTKARKKLAPDSEVLKFEIMLDMMLSHLSGKHLLSDSAAAYTAVGLMIVAAATGVGITIVPVATLATDIAVLSFIYTILRNEIEEYVLWRRETEPDYAPNDEVLL